MIVIVRCQILLCFPNVAGQYLKSRSAKGVDGVLPDVVEANVWRRSAAVPMAWPHAPMDPLQLRQASHHQHKARGCGEPPAGRHL